MQTFFFCSVLFNFLSPCLLKTFEEKLVETSIKPPLRVKVAFCGWTNRKAVHAAVRVGVASMVWVLTSPPLDASGWMEAFLTCMCVWPSFHSSALLGMSSTPPQVGALKKTTRPLFSEADTAEQVSRSREFFQAPALPHPPGPAASASRQDQTESRL